MPVAHLGWLAVLSSFHADKPRVVQHGAVLSRLANFLPQMEAANQRLQVEMQVSHVNNTRGSCRWAARVTQQSWVQSTEAPCGLCKVC